MVNTIIGESVMKQLLKVAIAGLINMMSPTLLKKFAGVVIKWVEAAVKESEIEFAGIKDDDVILPLCSIVKKAFDIK